MRLIFVFCIIPLIAILQPGCATELLGGVSASAINGEIQGIATPTTNLINVDGDVTLDSISPGDMIDFSALVLDSDNELGVVKASRSYYSEPNPLPDAGGSSSSYKLCPWSWQNTNPMQLYVITSGLPSGITASSFTQSVTDAALTWNTQGGATRQLFSETAIKAPTGTKAKANDGKFVHSFTYSWSGWLAQNRLIYNTGTGSLKDADVQYNRRYKWTTDWDTAVANNKKIIDLETVATHELGHNVGLNDLYNDAKFKWDTQQIMNSYSHPQHWLGLGDIAGVKAKNIPISLAI